MEIYKHGGGSGSFKFAGTIDCRAPYPLFPTALAGEVWIVSHAGYIGGDPLPSTDNGQPVNAGDFLVAEIDNPGGTYAAQGINWTIIPTATATLYSNATPILSALGGIEVGETFSNQTMQQMWDNLLYPYLGPLINTVTLNPAATYYENGDTIVLPIIGTNVTVRSDPFTSLVLSRSGSAWTNVYTLPIVSGAQVPVNDPADVTDTTTYTVTANDGVGPAITKTATYTFIYPYYYGEDADGLNGAQIRALTNVISPPTDDLTLTFSPNAERVYFAIPPGATPYTQVLDQNLFDVTADFLPSSTISITGLDGTSQTYMVYEIDHDIGDGSPITFTFKF